MMECSIDGLGTLRDEHEGVLYPKPRLFIYGLPPIGPDDELILPGSKWVALREPAWKGVKRWMDATKPEGEALELCEAFVGRRRVTWRRA